MNDLNPFRTKRFSPQDVFACCQQGHCIRRVFGVLAFTALLMVLCVPLPAVARGKRISFLWEDMSDGLYSLDGMSVVVDPVNSKRIYAATDGILYRSEDKGLSWTILARFRGANRANLGAIRRNSRFERLKRRLLDQKLEELRRNTGEDPTREQQEEAEREAEQEARAQIRRRSRGLNPQQTNSRYRRNIQRIVISPKNNKHILLATDGGAFLSTDGGKNFRSSYRGRGGEEGNVRCAAFDPSNPKRIFLGTRKGLWFSVNGGKLWKRIFGKIQTLVVHEIRFDPNKPNRIYAVTDRSVFLSRNTGTSFREIYSIPSTSSNFTSMTLLATKPTTTVLVGSNNGMFRSVRYRRFQRIPARGLSSRRIMFLTSVPTAPEYVYLTTDQGIFFSSNRGTSFTHLRSGLLSNAIRNLAASPHEPMEIWAATDYGILRWSKVVGGKLTKAGWAKLKRRLGMEPSAYGLARQALRYMNISMALQRAFVRQRERNWLPRVVVRGRWYLDKDQNYFLIRKPIPTGIAEGRQIVLEVNAVWRLRGLLTNTRNINFNQQLLVIRRLRQKLMERVIRLFYARRRLQIRLASRPPQTVRMYLRRILKLQELTAYIDALTGGYLSRRTRQLRAKAWKPY